ncbi:MAG: ATP-binding protein [Acidimicrobiia bacterium]|nr:ATP-binding protein [Acidimicrobiia bacterium]
MTLRPAGRQDLVSLVAAPLVDREHLRVPFMVAHVVAYGAGVVAMSPLFGPVDSFGRAMAVVYAAVLIAAIVAWIRGTAPFASFLLVDAIATGTVPLLTGQHPASVHVTLVVVVFAAAVSSPGRMAWLIAVVAGSLALGGVIFGPPQSAIPVTAEQVWAMESAGTWVGLGVGAMAIVILLRLLRASQDRQRAALEAERQSNLLQQRFIAMVSHELRTPLTSVRGFADVLVDPDIELDPGERVEFTEAIAAQAGHLTRLVDDVLVVLRIQAGKLSVRSEAVDVADRIQVALQMTVIADGKSVDHQVERGLTARADPDRLVQVVRNLVENASRYGGSAIRLSAARRGGRIQIVVEDDGVGVPADMTEAVFDEFVQVGNPAERVSAGFGLGLPIARRLVVAMGGSIELEPSDMGGARFVIGLAAQESSIS